MAEALVFMRSLPPSWSGYPAWGIGPVCRSPEEQEKWIKDNIPEVSTTTQSAVYYLEKWKIQPIPATYRLPGGKALIDHMAATLMNENRYLSSGEEETKRLSILGSRGQQGAAGGSQG